MTRFTLTVTGGLVPLVLLGAPLSAQDYSWPREIQATAGTIVLYQPQAEQLTGNTLTARGAIALKVTGRADPIFGAMWMSATVDVDRDSGEVWIHNVRVTRVRWPDVTPEQQQRFTQFVETDFPAVGFRMSIERLQASLASAEAERSHIEGLKSDAPKIVFSEQLAVLLLYDGEPRTQPIDSTNLELVVNTPFGVVRDKATGTYYLGGGNIWYSAPDPKGPWTAPATPPAELAARSPTDSSAGPPPTNPPAVIAASEPTELVVTQGPPSWKTTAGGKLLYVENTETPWIRETEGTDNYILISGRWFRSASVAGPWSFARPDSLPASFQEIPPESPIGGVRSSIALTVEAQDALLDLQIPQTTAVQRSSASLTVTYDGPPNFSDIAGTSVAYATNTATPVLRAAGAYYACDNGVWFTSASAAGPWAVADTIPTSVIKQIPPSSPVYNLTYVEIYGSTPEVVYVGYTPGYMWTYPYYGVPVYGTGWHYVAHYGAVYYPRPVTYGVAVSYNPYAGWGVGTTWATGFFAFGVGVAVGRGGYYPPGGYRGCYNCTINVGGGGRNNVNIGNSVGGGRGRPGNRPSAGTRPSTRPSTNNLYNRPENRTRNADRSTRDAASRQMGANRTARGSNNVFADRNGDVHRRTSGGWESRQGNSWSRDGSRGGAGASNRAGGSRGGMEREWQARQRSSSRSYGGGGGRGGGRGGGGGRRR